MGQIYLAKLVERGIELLGSAPCDIRYGMVQNEASAG